MDEKGKAIVVPIGVSAWPGLVLCIFAEKIMKSAENDFKLYKAKAQDTSCLVSWYYKRKAIKSFKVWQDGWIHTTNFKHNMKKLNAKVSEKVECDRDEQRENKEEKTKVRKPNSQSKRSKVCE